MVARRTTPPAIDLAGLDDPLADALRQAARGEEPVQLTDGGRPLAQITPIRTVETPDAKPYVFDPAEHERVMERRNHLRAAFAKLGPPEMSAVEMIREQRRHAWEE